MFIGTSTFSASQFHRDTFGSAFFSIQLCGTKRWRIYDQRDVAFLYPSLIDDVHFDVTDVHSTQQQQKYPLLKLARFIDIQVNPGDLLYVPAGLPHQVNAVHSTNNTCNMTIMLGMNVVNLANLPSVLQATKPKRLLPAPGNNPPIYFTKQKYEVLYTFFAKYQTVFEDIIEWDVQHMPWRRFKSRKLEVISNGE